MNLLNSISNPLITTSLNIGGLPEDPTLTGLSVTGVYENSIDISFNYTNVFKANINMADVGSGGSITTASKNAHFRFPLNVPNLNPGRTYNLNVDSYNKKIYNSNNTLLPVSTTYSGNPIYTLSKITDVSVNTFGTDRIDLSFVASDLSAIGVTTNAWATYQTFNRATLLSDVNSTFANNVLKGNATVIGLSAGKSYTFGMIPYNYVDVSGATYILSGVTTLSKVNAVGIKAIGITTMDLSLNTSDLSYVDISGAGFTTQRFTKLDISGSSTGSFDSIANVLKGNVTVTGLTASTTYTFYITAFNSNNKESTSMNVSANTAVSPLYTTKSLQFTFSTNMYATKTSNFNYYAITPLSIEAWIKIPIGTLQGGRTTGAVNTANYGAIVLKQAWCGILADRNNNLKVFFNNADVYPNGNTTLNVGDGNWHHVAVSLIAGTNTSAIYIDGVKKEMFTWSTYTNTADLMIGNNPYFGDANYRTPFVGKISYVRYWNTNLSDSFITNNYNKYLNPTTNTNLIGFFPFVEGSGNILTNLAIGNTVASNSNVLNITGSPTWSTDSPTIYL